MVSEKGLSDCCGCRLGRLRQAAIVFKNPAGQPADIRYPVSGVLYYVSDIMYLYEISIIGIKYLNPCCNHYLNLEMLTSMETFKQQEDPAVGLW